MLYRIQNAVLALSLFSTFTISTNVYAEEALQVPMKLVDNTGIGNPIGNVTITESIAGLVFTPHLTKLPPGSHGFHVHENGSCELAEKDGKPVPAGTAGGHFDPHAAKHHGAPTGDGHLGDLPPLIVSPNGSAVTALTAPRLTRLSEVRGKALMVHLGGDNFSDEPAPLGGGGVRIACGVIE
jgi:Cu-Zn family superoxide dismutase